MAGYTCPFCGQTMSLNESTLSQYRPCFMSPNGAQYGRDRIQSDTVEISFFKCPNCDKISIELNGYGKLVKHISLPVFPSSKAKQFPEYIPLQLRQDYEEAFAIVNLSPKASATLSRRCMQGMIRDYWGITKNNLSAAIDELKTKVQPSL